MIKYQHSKTGNKVKSRSYRSGSVDKVFVARGLRKKHSRAVANHTTVENTFGAGFPKFGAALGVSYSVDGTISKADRAKSLS